VHLGNASFYFFISARDYKPLNNRGVGFYLKPAKLFKTQKMVTLRNSEQPRFCWDLCNINNFFFRTISLYNEFMGHLNNREFARSTFLPGMWVKVVRKNHPPSEYKMYQLIDLSQGGISFKSQDINEFKRGDEFYILEIERKVLAESIVAIVRYVEPIDKFGIDFKVGVEFQARV
jgi:hypothetical protein